MYRKHDQLIDSRWLLGAGQNVFVLLLHFLVLSYCLFTNILCTYYMRLLIVLSSMFDNYVNESSELWNLPKGIRDNLITIIIRVYIAFNHLKFSDYIANNT